MGIAHTGNMLCHVYRNLRLKLTYIRRWSRYHGSNVRIEMGPAVHYLIRRRRDQSDYLYVTLQFYHWPYRTLIKKYSGRVCRRRLGHVADNGLWRLTWDNTLQQRIPIVSLSATAVRVCRLGSFAILLRLCLSRWMLGRNCLWP